MPDSPAPGPAERERLLRELYRGVGKLLLDALRETPPSWAAPPEKPTPPPPPPTYTEAELRQRPQYRGRGGRRPKPDDR